MTPVLLLTGSKRQSHADFESEFEEPDHRMTEEHVKFLQWFYRTEDRKSDPFAFKETVHDTFNSVKHKTDVSHDKYMLILILNSIEKYTNSND